MDVQIAARHMDLTPALVGFIHKKLHRVQKYFVVNAVHVVLKCEKRRQTVQVVLSASGTQFRACETAGDLYSAFDLVTDKIDMQIKKYKEKRTLHHGKNKYGRDAVTALPERINIHKAETVIPGIMSVQEAVEELAANRKKMLVFQDRETNQLRVLEKRNSRYELITIINE